MRQVKFANDNLDVNTEIVFVAQDLNHSSARILRGRGPVGDFNIHDDAFEIVPFRAPSGLVAQNAVNGLPRTGFPWDTRRDASAIRNLHAWWDYDFLGNLLVDRRDIVPAIAVVKDSHDRAVCTDDGTNDATFSAAVGADRADLHQHAVAVHCRAYRGWRNENIPREQRFKVRVEGSGIGSDKTVAVAVHAQFSYQNVLAGSGLRNRVAIRVDLNQLATVNQALQARGEFLTRRTMQSQFPHQLLEACGAFGLAFNLLQDGGIGEFVQDRGLSAAQIIILRRCRCDGSTSNRVTRDSIRTAILREELHPIWFLSPCTSRLRKGPKVQKAQNFHKT